jgi:dTDP-4-amino-4,6-dideoxygalactose transaminase
MNVPTLDLKAQYEPLRSEIDSAIKDIIDNTAFILGKTVTDFEEMVNNYNQSKGSVGVSSGTDALLIALMAEGIGHGDEVISTGFTFFATTGTIARSGAKPVLVDIDPLTFNIDPAKIEEKITSRTKAIMPVHLYGQAAAMDEIMKIAKKHNLVVIEDGAQAIGTELNGTKVGNFGDYGCFSFFPSKNLGAVGDAGLVTTNDEKKLERLRQFRTHGQTSTYYHEFIGGNFRIDTLHAAVLKVKLPHLDNWSEGRQQNAAKYRELFKNAGLAIDHSEIEDKINYGLTGRKGVVLPYERENGRHIYNQFVLRTDRRDDLLKHLNDNGVGARVYYPVPMHLQPCFADLGYKKGDLPVAEKACEQVLALPIYTELTDEMLGYVVEKVAEFFETK